MAHSTQQQLARRVLTRLHVIEPEPDHADAALLLCRAIAAEMEPYVRHWALDQLPAYRRSLEIVSEPNQDFYRNLIAQHEAAAYWYERLSACDTARAAPGLLERLATEIDQVVLGRCFVRSALQKLTGES